MLCRKCGKKLKLSKVEELRSVDQKDNSNMLIMFDCAKCGIGFDGIYEIVGLWCINRGPKGGGGAFPLDYDEAHKMFKPPKKVRKGSRTKKR